MPDVPYHTQAQAIIDMINAGAASSPSLAEQGPESARLGYGGWYGMNGPGPEISEVRDVAIPGTGGHSIPARIYRPTTAADAPLRVFFHGGGMATGPIDGFHGVARSRPSSPRTPGGTRRYPARPAARPHRAGMGRRLNRRRVVGRIRGRWHAVYVRASCDRDREDD